MMKFFSALLILAQLLPSVAFTATSVSDDQSFPAKSYVVNGGAENGKAGYALFHSGTTAPTTLTGGVTTGNLALLVTTTPGEVLEGKQSLKLVRSAASAQGDGVSTSFTIPESAKTSSLAFSLKFKVNSGSIVQGDVKAFIYDVTNSQIITPFNNDIVGSAGTVTMPFSANTTSTSYMLGVYFASTAATALSLSLDGISVSPQFATLGMAGSNVTPYSLTIGASTTAPTITSAAINSARWSRVGDRMIIAYDFQLTAGSAGSGNYKFPLPSGYAIDTTKQTLNSIGSGSSVGPASCYRSTTMYTGFVFAYDATDLGMNVGGFTVGSGGCATDLANQVYSFVAAVPIAGWDANVSMASSSTWDVSTYLATGTRVTGSAPTTLGSYRSYLRNAGANTFTETNGAPTAAPNTTDGMKIYTSATFAAADASGQPSKYDIFVGRNKRMVKANFYTAAGKVGSLVVTPYVNGTTDTGIGVFYDSSTGIVTVQKFNAANTNLSLGSDGSYTTYTAAWFDITVSENALAVGNDTHDTISNNTNERIERAMVTTICTSTPCTIASQSGSWLSSISRSGSGDYLLNIASGMFSAPPSCSFTALSASTDRAVQISPNSTPTATSVEALFQTRTFGALDVSFSVTCMGPR